MLPSACLGVQGVLFSYVSPYVTCPYAIKFFFFFFADAYKKSLK